MNPSRTFTLSELKKAFDFSSVPGDGDCMFHSVCRSLERLGTNISTHELKQLLGVHQVLWDKGSDQNGVGEDFEHILIRLSTFLEISIVVFVEYSGTFYPIYINNGSDVIYLKLQGRHYEPLIPCFERVAI